MSWVSIGPRNEGGSQPYATDPVYRDACVCDLSWKCDEAEVGAHEGEANVARLKAAGKAVKRDVEHACDECYQWVMCASPGDEED